MRKVVRICDMSTLQKGKDNILCFSRKPIDTELTLIVSNLAEKLEAINPNCNKETIIGNEQ